MPEQGSRISAGSLDPSAAGDGPNDSPFLARAWKQITGVTTKFGDFDKHLTGMLAPNTGTLAKLDAALSHLSETISKVDKNLAAVGSGGGGPSSGAPSTGTNPHSGFGGDNTKSPSSGAVLGRRVAEFGAAVGYGLGRLSERSTSQFTDISPGLTSLNISSGNVLGSQGIARTLAGSTFSANASSPLDAVTSAILASRLSGGGINSPQGRNFSSAVSQIAFGIPGVDRTQAAQILSQLSSPYANNTFSAFTGASFIGRGGVATNPASTAYQIASSLTGIARPTTAQIQSALVPNSAGYQQLVSTVGSPDLANVVVQLAQEQANYTAGGGTGSLDLTNKRSRSLAGANDPVLNAMRRNLQMKSSDQLTLYGKQAGTYASTIDVQTSIEHIGAKTIEALGPTGIIAQLLSKLVAGLLGSGVANAALSFFGARAGAGGIGSILGNVLTGGGAAEAGAAGVAGIGGLGAAGIGAAGLAEAGATVGEGVELGRMRRSKNGVQRTIGNVGGATFVAGLNTVIPGAGSVLGHLTHAFGDPPSGPMMHGPMNVASGHVGDPSTDILQSRDIAPEPDAISGLNPSFRNQIAQLLQANPRLRINSGYRSNARQAQLFAAAVKKYGSAQAASKWVAPPGQSMHGKGLAVDLGPSSEYGWLAANAGKYGLWNYSPEPWHWEPKGARSATGTYSPDGSSTTGATSDATSSASSAVGGVTPVLSSINLGTYGGSQGALMQALLGSPTEQGANLTGVQYLAGVGGAVAAATAAGGVAGGTGSGPFTGTLSAGTRAQFAADILAKIGAPNSKSNIGAMLAWMAGESAPGLHDYGAFNVFNFNQFDNATGRYGFPSWGAAVQAMANRLTQAGIKNPIKAYQSIAQAFDANSDPHQILQLVQQSPWASGHYHGTLPGVYDQVLKNWDQYANDRIVGDPATPMGGGIGGPVTVRGGTSIYAPIVMQVMQASESEAMRLADRTATHLKTKMAIEEARSN